MRLTSGAVAAVFLAAGFAFAQSTSAPAVPPTSSPSAGAPQGPATSADDAKMEGRLAALEQKIQQLELENQQLRSRQLELEKRMSATGDPTSAAAASEAGVRLAAGVPKAPSEHNAKVKAEPTVTAGRETFAIVS